ncbi:fibrous sheath-interacting protein 1 isoform X2 [Lepisosteus oculatus]|uniref:fibrous sheath-interacting protein 1 isoform X2 n=1 Tax=Lepisosteus oculatus TaxID=7918 RepID=UPI00371B8783
MDIRKGSLDAISRPASSCRSRPGSRASGAALQERGRVSSSSSGSLVVLTPEAAEVQDNMIVLENISFSSDSSDGLDDELRSEFDHLAANREGGNNHMSFVPEEKGDSDIYGKSPCKNIETNTSLEELEDNGDENSLKFDESDEENEDPELQKAIRKMKKLDNILAQKVSREREVKKHGKKMRLKLWEELQSTKLEGVSESHDEAENTKLFLALTSSKISGSSEDVDFIPVFDTQIPVEEYGQRIKPSEQIHDNQCKSTETSRVCPDEDKSDLAARGQCDFNRGKKKQDFVKKNIEMAKDAGNQVLMTDEEKKRLAELLKDIDKDGNAELPNDEGDPTLWALRITAGEGYTPEPTELDQLLEIDSKLQVLLSPEDFLSLHSPYSNHSVLLGPGTALDDYRDTLPGEKVLQDMKEIRGQESRLKEIEQQLEHLDQNLESAEQWRTGCLHKGHLSEAVTVKLF